jgi:putative NIF3 family GTP cyclohydrolase 1 type 2
MLEIEVEKWWCEPTNVPRGVLGQAPAGMTVPELVARVEERLQTEVRLLAHGPRESGRVAIVSGFGADKVAEAHALGADTFLTGETSHANYWSAQDYGLNLLYAGHYATETVGVRALGYHLAQTFDLEVQFFDFPTQM